MDPTRRLRVNEIFHSLQGEGATSGRPCAFVRLTGCPLRCSYCDTEYAFHEGEWRDFDEIIAACDARRVRDVCVTGGEPLAQPQCPALLTELCDRGYRVVLETGGALPIADIDPRVSRALDLKTPDSGECDRNDYDNLEELRPSDLVKLVICSRSDYEWARERIRSRDWPCEVFLSPAWQSLEAAQLADWMLEDDLPARLQVQLHKVLWGDVRGR